MRIEQALGADVPEIARLIEDCIQRMRAEGIVQWDAIYPNREIIEADAQSGTLWVARHAGRCLATVCLNETQSPEYSSASWQNVEGKILVVHRLCVDPQWQGKGLGWRMLTHAERYASENGFASIRLDVYTGNPRAMALYERNGYQRAGQVIFPRRPLPFECFEKSIDYSFRAGGMELLPRIQPLWEELRDHHGALSPKFSRVISSVAFQERFQKLAAKASTGDLRVDLMVNRTNGKECGYCVTTVGAGGRNAEIDSLFVQPAFRKRGAGSGLLQRALEWLQQKGAESPAISVIFGNEEALRFYEKHGFHPRSLRLPQTVNGGEEFDP